MKKKSQFTQLKTDLVLNNK